MPNRLGKLLADLHYGVQRVQRTLWDETDFASPDLPPLPVVQGKQIHIAIPQLAGGLQAPPLQGTEHRSTGDRFAGSGLPTMPRRSPWGSVKLTESTIGT